MIEVAGFVGIFEYEEHRPGCTQSRCGKRQRRRRRHEAVQLQRRERVVTEFIRQRRHLRQFGVHLL